MFNFQSFRDILLDEEKGMYERYAALFALRNDGGDEAVFAIVDSLGAKSALLRHEVSLTLIICALSTSFVGQIAAGNLIYFDLSSKSGLLNINLLFKCMAILCNCA